MLSSGNSPGMRRIAITQMIANLSLFFNRNSTILSTEFSPRNILPNSRKQENPFRDSAKAATKSEKWRLEKDSRMRISSPRNPRVPGKPTNASRQTRKQQASVGSAEAKPVQLALYPRPSRRSRNEATTRTPVMAAVASSMEIHNPTISRGFVVPSERRPKAIWHKNNNAPTFFG